MTDDTAPPGPVRTRFAPSPTGHLHVGVVRTALFAWALARHSGGQFILRIEDTDKSREVPGTVQSIQNDLRWLSLDWDEGPDIGGPVGPYVQSERLPTYNKHIAGLIESGHAYRCFCTKERLETMREARATESQSTGYDRLCRGLARDEADLRHLAGEPSVIRIAMPLDGETTWHDALRGPVTFDNRMLDDFVAIKSDGFPTYNFANVIDDHLMAITHVIRGEEFISSTPKFAVLYRHLGWTPPVMLHCALVLGPNRAKLSKRHGDTSVSEYAEAGYLPDALVNFLALLGWSPGHDREVLTRGELVSLMSIDRFQKHAAIFDREKLDWMNAEYLRAMSREHLAETVRPWLVNAGLIEEPLDPQVERTLIRAIPLVQERIKRLAQAPDQMACFFLEEVDIDPEAAKQRLSSPDVGDLLEAVALKLEEVADFDDGSAVERAVRAAGESLGALGGAVIHPVRVAVTGRTTGPSLFDAMSVIGRDRCMSRLKRAAAMARG